MRNVFLPLRKAHLPLLFSWIVKPHIKDWWDPGIVWTAELFQDKYGSYPDGYYIEDGVKKHLQAFIVEFDNNPVAYVQLYNAHSYPLENSLQNIKLPDICVGLDMFIGAEDLVGKGIGTEILKDFLMQHVHPNFDACLVDPDKKNHRAIRAYEKAGFKSIGTQGKYQWMLWQKENK